MATHFGSLRSSTAYPSSSSTIHGFCIYTNFYYEVMEPGKTKVTWSFQAGYDNYGSYPATSTYASAGITITLTATKGTISNISGNSYSGSSIRYKDWPVLSSSGSCIITHDSSGAASFNIYADVSVGGWDCDSSGSLTLPTNVPYTACGAPTTVSASGIVAPSGSFTVSWSGATNGVSNNIKSYQVYWYITSGGTAPSTSTYTGTKEVDVTDGTTSGSYTVTLSSATRGHKIVCGVKALSSLGAAYDSELKTGGSVTVNSLPAAPSVSVNKTVVPSSNGQVTFTVTAGADSDSSQTRTLYYTTASSRPTNTSQATKITSPWSPTVSAKTTYYFWTYDGLEFSSSSTSKTIIKNSKPKISSVTIDESEILESKNSVSEYNYLIKPKITVTSEDGQSSKKYNYYIDYGTSASLGSRKTISTSDSATTKTITDIRTYDLGHSSSGAYYKITVKCNDGVEDSAELSSKIYYITKRPALVGVYNKSGYQNVSGYYENSKATHFSKYLGFRFDRDQGYTKLKIVDNNNSFTKEISLTTTTSYTQGYFSETNSLSSNISYTFSLSLGASSYDSGSVSHSITRIGIPTLTKLNASITHKYFSNNDKVYTGNVGHSFPNSPIDNAIKNYGFSSKLTSSKFVIAIIRGEGQVELNGTSISTISSGIAFTIPASSLNQAGELFSLTERNSLYENLKLSIKLTNDFGDIITIDTTNTDNKIAFDFREDDSITAKTYSIYPTGDSTSNTIDKWMYLCPGMKSLTGNFTISSYNTNPKGEIQIKRSTESSWKTLKSFTFTKTSSADASPGSPATYSASDLLIQSINSITTKNYTVNYKLVVTTDATTSSSKKKELDLYNNIPVKGHTAPQIIVKNSSYNPETKKISVEYEVSDWGAQPEVLVFGTENNPNKIWFYPKKDDGSYNTDTSASYTLTNTELSTFFTTTSKSASFNYDFGSKENTQVKMRFYTRLYAYLASDKDKKTPYYENQLVRTLDSTEPFSVFNILPTVSYRKNHLGINVLNPSSEDKSNAIIVIGEVSNRDSIYFQSASSKLCKIENFCIDCGTW